MALLSAVRPVRRFYLGLTANPYDALSTVTWTEIVETSGRQAEVVNLRWGAQHELARVEPSYVSITFDNRLGDFDPLKSAGPYYPNLRPLNRLRIVDTWGGVDYIRFTGYVVDWPRSWTGYNQAFVTIEAYDALGAVLNSVDIPRSTLEFQIRKIIEQLPSTGKATWLRLNESSGTVAADSSGFALNGQYQGSPTYGVNAGMPDEDDAVAFTAGSRVSLPYKNLVSGYPWSLSFRTKVSNERTRDRVFFSAYDGPVGGTLRQYVQVYLESNLGVMANAGKMVAEVLYFGIGTQVMTTITIDDGASHNVVLVFTSATNFKIYVDGTDRTNLTSATAHTFPNDLLTGYAVGNTPATAYGDFYLSSLATDYMDEVVVFDGLALSATQVSDLHSATAFFINGITALSGWRLSLLLDDIGWPAADTDIDDGVTNIQQGFTPGKANAWMQKVDETEGGRLFVNGAGQIVFHDRHRIFKSPYTVSQATFGEATGEINYVGPFNHGEDDLDIHNDVRVGNVGGTVQVARSVASKNLYGWRTLSRTDLLGISDEEARDRANHDLATYSTPVTRVRSITIKPQEDAAQGTTVWPNLLGLGQNSRVTVKAQPPGTPLWGQVSHVERMEETVTKTDWQMTLGLSAAQTSMDFAVWGTSTWGSGRWAY